MSVSHNKPPFSALHHYLSLYLDPGDEWLELMCGTSGVGHGAENSSFSICDLPLKVPGVNGKCNDFDVYNAS
jgi:hypothetical protein